MKIVRLEDLEVWQEARKLANMVYDVTDKFPKEETYNIKKHLRVWKKLNRLISTTKQHKQDHQSSRIQ